MTAYDFSLVKNTSFAFDASAGDSINFGAIDASSLSLTQSGSDLVVSDGTDTVTLTGMSVSAITTTNFTFGTASDRPAVGVGDNATGTTFDSAGNTLDMDSAANLTGFTNAQSDANNLVYGFGGADTISVGDGNNLIFGGSGVVDSTDGADTINIGDAAIGSNTVYGNAGGDTITLDVASAASTTNTLYLGLGDDSLDDNNQAHAGNFVVHGNAGDDDIDLSAVTGDATIYGGNGVVDSASGADQITIGSGSALIYSNSGNDTITTGNTTAADTVSIFGGLGDDNITAGTTVANSKTVLYGNDGSDTFTLTNAAGDVTVFGGDGIYSPDDDADTIVLGEGNSLVYANAGDDAISLVGGIQDNDNATIYTGAGADTVTVSVADPAAGANGGDGSTITIYSNSGDDTFNIDNDGGTNVEYAFNFADFDSADTINITLDGANAATQLTVTGGGSSLTLTDTNEGSYVFTGYAGDLNATNFVVSDGSRLITNFSGTAATLTGSTGADHLVSGSSGDTLIGGETATGTTNKLVGGAGDDTFQLDDLVAADQNNNAQTLSGGDGTDTLEITGGAAVTLAANDFTAAWTGVEVIKLNNLDNHNITLAAAANTSMGLTTIDASALTGTNNFTLDDGAFNSALTITGGDGADVITRDNGTVSSDTMSLDAGADQLTTTDEQLTSGDTIDGGAGNDTIIFTDAITLADSVFTNITNVEAIQTAANQESTITVGSEMDEAGVVTIDGSNATGTNSLVITANTSSENMSITGGAANDTLIGGTGNDTLLGGQAEGALGNVLTGGTGTNTFKIDQGGATETSTITDFLTGTSNILSLSAATFADLVGGNEYLNTTANLVAIDFADDNDGGDDIVVITDASYANKAAAWGAIDDATQLANNDDANDEMLLIFLDTGGFVSVVYETNLSNDFGGATSVEVARITDIDSVADMQAAFTGAATSISEVNLFV